MHGIAGIINLNNSETAQSVPLLKMTRQMIHRGPYGEGILQS